MKVVCEYCGEKRQRSCPSKRCRIVYLLGHWEDIHDSSSQRGLPGGGSNTPNLGSLAGHASVRELVRCLDVLRGEVPVQCAHLMAFYRSEWRIEHVPKRSQNGKTVMRRDHLGILVVDTTPHRQRLVPSWVRLEKVRRGVDRLTELFRGGADLPEDFEWALHLSNEAAEAKRIARKSRRQRVAA